MQKLKVRVRKKGQITLPQELRSRWGIGEGSVVVITAEEDKAIIRPVRRTKVKDDAGSLGQADSAEVEYAIMDPDLIFQYYLKKYGR